MKSQILISSFGPTAVNPIFRYTQLDILSAFPSIREAFAHTLDWQSFLPKVFWTLQFSYNFSLLLSVSLVLSILP